MTDHTARDRRLAAGRARRARLGLDELPERPSRPGRPVTPGGTQPQERYSEADIDGEVGWHKDRATHIVDVRNWLRMHYGYSFEVKPNILEGQSNNLRAVRTACLARRDPLAAARMVNTWVGAELVAGTARGKQMHFWENEFDTNNYCSWVAGGHLETLSELENSKPIHVGFPAIEEIDEACANLRTWLGRLQALLALLAVPGRIRNLQGRVAYEGPCVFAAGLRSIARREGNNARTPVAAALLEGGQYVGDPGPLASAIKELWDAQGRVGNPMAILWDQPVSKIRWDLAVRALSADLAGTRTAMHFQARVYADGTKMSCLLGPKGASSTAETRLVIVRGPEISDCTVVTPHAEGDERTVPASDARVSEDGLFRTWTHGKVGHATELPAGEPVVQLDTYPDRPEEWSGTAVRS